LGIHNFGALQETGISDDRQAAKFLVLARDNGLVAAPGNGGPNEGALGPRFAIPNAYGAYLRDPDDHVICAYIVGLDRA
jgi:hypothetical protein